MKENAIIFILLMLLFGCDPFSRAILSNEKSNDITFQVFIDTSILRYYTSSKYMLLSSYAHDSNVKIIKIDTNALIGTFKIKAHSKATIEGNNADIVYFKFNKMKVFSGNDTIDLSSREDIIEAFKKTSTNSFTFTIK